MAPGRRPVARPYFGDSATPWFSTESMLILGDNLDALPLWVRDESVDPTYLDPPFNSNPTYDAIFRQLVGPPAAGIRR